MKTAMTYIAWMSVPRLLAAVVFVLGCSSAFAGAEGQDEAEENEKAWREIALQLPAAPLQENLLPFYVSPTATQGFAIDGKSVSVGKDGVVRYTMVSVGSGGARNVSFEGMHCAQLQKRVYAFGRADGSWSRSRRESWDPIIGGGPNKAHAVLVNEFFCRDKTVAGTAEQMVARIRREGGLTMQGRPTPQFD